MGGGKAYPPSASRLLITVILLVVLVASSAMQLGGNPSHGGAGCTPAASLHLQGGMSGTPLAEPIVGVGTYTINYYLSPDEFLALNSIAAGAPPLDNGVRRPFLTLTGPLSDIEVDADLAYLNVSGVGTVSLVETDSVDPRLESVLGTRALQVDIDPGRGVILYHNLSGDALELVRGKRVLPDATVVPVNGSVSTQLALLIGTPDGGGGGGCPLLMVETPGSKYALSTSKPWPLLLPVEPGKVSVAFRETGTSVTTLRGVKALLLPPPDNEVVAVEVNDNGDPIDIAYINPSDVITPPGTLALGAPVYPLLPGSTVTQAFKISVSAGWYIVISLRDPYGRSFYENIDTSLRMARALLDLAPEPSGRRGVPLPKSTVEVFVNAGGSGYSFNITSPSPLDVTILAPVPTAAGPANVSVSVTNRGLVGLGVDYIGIVPGASISRQLSKAEPLSVVPHSPAPIVLREASTEAKFEVNVPERGLLVLWPDLSVRPLDSGRQDTIVYLPVVNLTAAPSAALSATLPTQAVLIPDDAELVGLMLVLLNADSTSVSRVLADKIVLYYKPEIYLHDDQIIIEETCPDIPNAGQSQHAKDVAVHDFYYEAEYTSLVLAATYGASVNYENVFTPVTYSNALILASQVIVSNVTNTTLYTFDPIWETALGIDAFDGAYVIDEWIAINDFNSENITPLPADDSHDNVGSVVHTAPLILSGASLLLDTAGIIVAVVAPEAGLATAMVGALSAGSTLGSLLVSQLETPEPSPLGSHELAFRRIYNYQETGGPSANPDGVPEASMSAVIQVGATNQAGEGAEVRLTFYLPPGPKFYEDAVDNICTPMCNCLYSTLKNVTVSIHISPVRYP